MNSASMKKSRPALEAAYVPRFDGDVSTRTHVLGGDALPRGGTCLNCNLPFTLMMDLDLRSDALSCMKQLGIPRLVLMFCWRCNVPSDDLVYRVAADSSIDLLSFRSGRESLDFPYGNYPVSFPKSRFRLVETANSVERKPRHQIGGTPFTYQGLRDIKCPFCGDTMPFLCTVSDHAGEGASFAVNAYAQVVFHVCLLDAVVTAYQDCS